MGKPSSVWDAIKEPINTAANQPYPASKPTPAPTARGMENVSNPNANDRRPVRRNWDRSISSPTKNINSSLPTSAKNSATGAALGRVPRPLGPRATPASNNPTPGGIRIRRQIGGMNRKYRQDNGKTHQQRQVHDR